jgi:hypothetical protein
LKIQDWLKSLKNLLIRVLGILSGGAVVVVISDGFDWLVYPAVTRYFGEQIWLSFLVLSSAALILNYLMVLAYDFLKKDIFGFEDWKEFKNQMKLERNKKMWQKIILWAESRSKALLMAILAFKDPFILVIYCRNSTKFDGFKMRDHIILILGTLTACGIWSALWSWIVLL